MGYRYVDVLNCPTFLRLIDQSSLQMEIRQFKGPRFEGLIPLAKNIGALKRVASVAGVRSRANVSNSRGFSLPATFSQAQLLPANMQSIVKSESHRKVYMCDAFCKQDKAIPIAFHFARLRSRRDRCSRNILAKESHHETNGFSVTGWRGTRRL